MFKTRKNKNIAQKVIIFWQIYVASGGGYIRKRISATTCYINLPEKYCFLAEMLEINGFSEIILRLLEKNTI